jgi:hypothetical protein
MPQQEHVMKKTVFHMIRQRWLGLLLGLAAAGPGVLHAQQGDPAEEPSIDSVARLLDSPDFWARADGVSRLHRMEVASIPPTMISQVIALLEAEAVKVAEDPSSAVDESSTENEAYGEYLLALARAVLRFEDVRSLRGMALLGITTSKRAMQFVASQGAASLPHLDDAWALGAGMQGAVAQTWALMLGSYADRFTRDELVAVRRRIFGVLSTRPLAFAWAAQLAPIPEAVSLLDVLAESDANDIVRGRATAAAAVVRSKRDALSRRAILGTLDLWLDAFCVAPQGARLGACQSLDNLLADATKHVDGGGTEAAANTLRAFADRADEAFAEGALSEAERRLLAETARYLAERS